ncbi:MAG: preprotein translocase subunit SecG [Chloroflexi bacterium B3_Chlor]|nr:MAG: preprotein translocase subunit SecG [Chloroflexi bacterium B3_Chlor]
MTGYLRIVQMIISICLIAAILLQVKGQGLGGIFGGSDSGIYKTRRGAERTLFNLTVVLVVLFFLFALASVILQP